MSAEINHNVEWDLAIALSFESVVPKSTSQLPIADAINLVLAQDLTADIDLPPAHTAMMDGYAVFGQGPWKIVGELHAGSFLPYLETGCALKVSTGAHLPPHCSFVIPQELATLFEGDVASKNSFTPGQHIRQPGDEALAGESIAVAGTLLTPAVAGLAASSGIDEVLVFEIPSVSIVVTGSELASSGKPGPGQIRDSLSVQVTPWAQYLGAKVDSSINCADNLAELRESITKCNGDIVIVTGGSSFGEHDYLRPALEQLGAVYVVSEIWMRPGHPSLLAKLPDGKLVAGLPGNPLAALVSFMSVVAPALRGLSGQSEYRMGKIALAKDFACDRTRVVPIVVSSGMAEMTEFRGSAMLRGLSHADALGVISPGNNPAGTFIRVLPLPWRVN
ncbi:MAG: molybdopterin molybdotransferase MoeA [Candidatus Nanopelagicales bacterium]